MQATLTRTGWLFTLLFGLTFSLNAQVTSPAATAPALPEAPVGPITTIEFEEPEYDFGTINEGETVTHVFTFTNTGEEPMLMSNARGSCGCTVPQWPKDPIMPGETASITVEFNSKNKKGKQVKKVTITANTDPPQTFLYLKGEILANNDEGGMVNIEVPEPTISPDCFSIYPNPTAERLQLEVKEESLGKNASVSIFSQDGQLMAQREVPEVAGNIEFDVSHYPAGTYIANVTIGEGKPETQCFVVVK